MPGALQVVAGVIWCGPHLLLARRAPGKHLAGYWEFPGGKLEPGETYAEALRREIEEEFGLDIRVGEYIGYERFTYDAARPIDLHACEAHCDTTCDAGDSHDAVAWVTPADLSQYRLAPADAFIVQWLTQRPCKISLRST